MNAVPGLSRLLAVVPGDRLSPIPATRGNRTPRCPLDMNILKAFVPPLCKGSSSRAATASRQRTRGAPMASPTMTVSVCRDMPSLSEPGDHPCRRPHHARRRQVDASTPGFRDMVDMITHRLEGQSRRPNR